MEESAAAAGRDLSILSQLDWLAAGASDILGWLQSFLQCRPLLRDLYLLNRCSLEMGRDIELLGQSAAARYANYVWRMRDGHVSRLHSSVPRQETLRGVSLNCPLLFPESVVSLTAESFKGGVQLQSMSDSLKLTHSASLKRNDNRKRAVPSTPSRPSFKKVKSHPRLLVSRRDKPCQG